jgi:uncharacterized hydrophobic protein (TIGR00271 family)
MPTASSPERQAAGSSQGENERAAGIPDDLAGGAAGSQGGVRDAIRGGASLDGPFLLSNLAAALIATAGLLADNATTVIGAMLIATLTGPIMSVGLALVDYDNALLWRALRSLVAGTVIVVATGWLLGLLAPPMGVTSEMLSRTSPRLVDLVVALASGAVCAYALTTLA